jgi:uncharacterized membrane protein
MAALAYLFLPITGLIAYFAGRTARVRMHGLQAVVLGIVWPAALYGCSEVSVGAAQAAWAAGGVVWLALMIPAAFGKDVRIPGLGRTLERAARASPRE